MKEIFEPVGTNKPVNQMTEFIQITEDEYNDLKSTIAAQREQITSLSKGLDVYAKKVRSYSSALFFYEEYVKKIGLLVPPKIPEEAQFWEGI